jgi:aryl carrier-like protein
MADEFNANEAKLTIAEQDRVRALKAIEKERQRWDRAKATESKTRNRFEDLIAKAVSNEPLKVDWYQRPGPLASDQVRTAAKLDSVQLHRLMERYRKRHSKKTKSTRKKRRKQ